MTVVANAGEFVFVQRSFMAGFAFHLEMLAAQHVIGVAIMVEARRLPGFLAMAGLAFLAILTLMLILFFVTAIAV